MKIKNKSIELRNEQAALKKAEEQAEVRIPYAFRSEVSNKILVF